MRYQPLLSNLDDIGWKGMSSGWHNGFAITHSDETPTPAKSSWCQYASAISHPFEIRSGAISSGWYMVPLMLCHPDHCTWNNVFLYHKNGTYHNGYQGPVSIWRPSYLRMAISMLKIRRPLGRLIFNMGIAIPGKTVFLIETAPRLFLAQFYPHG